MLNFLIFVFFASTVGGKIQGIVSDAETDEPIINANVIIDNTNIGAATDDNGHFFILDVPTGVYQLEISCVGYQTKIVQDVAVEYAQTARMHVFLKQTTIAIEPVTVTSELPMVTKDMVGTTYVVGRSELSVLPVDYAADAIAFQPAVVRSDTAIHVRGGRVHDVLYMVDNVPVLDPQTGDPTVYVSKGSVNEVIFLPGGFDAEYGRAMSGVVNLLTSHPADRVEGTFMAKTETIMPYYYDFGYQDYQLSFHLPLSNRSKGFFSVDRMHTNDWNPKLYILPHKMRDDYSLYGKWFFSPSDKFKINLSGVKSRSQFDRYATLYKYHLDHYRSDMRTSDLQVLSTYYVPSSKSLYNLTLSRLYTERTYGVRESDRDGLFGEFRFRDYNTLEWPGTDIRNPFGIRFPLPYFTGDYPQYEEKSSHVLRMNMSTNMQVHRYHEMRAGFEYVYNDLKNFTYFVSDTSSPLIDEYCHKPKEYSMYIQDNIDYKGVFAKIGLRYDRFDTDIQGIKPKVVISPRLGLSFLITERFLFRANVSRFAQPPLYDYMYSLYSLLPLPSHITASGILPPFGNPNLGPEKTIGYEIGFQGEISRNLLGTFTIFYKDVVDLIGTRFINALPSDYWRYENIEYANIKGLEAILEFGNTTLKAKVSYTLSWARGTSSYAAETYFWWLKHYGDTTAIPPTTEYYLDFDQRHRFFVQGTARLPLQTDLYFFTFFGKGFPYTPPGPEGKYEERNILMLPDQYQIDCVMSKSFRIGTVHVDAFVEIINLLDTRNQIAYHEPLIPYDEVTPATYDYYIYLDNYYYSPQMDRNHDGMISPHEQYNAARDFLYATDDYVNSYTEPRRARIGVNIGFK